MLTWTIVFFLISIIAAFIGFREQIPTTGIYIAKLFFYFFFISFFVLLIASLLGSTPSQPPQSMLPIG